MSIRTRILLGFLAVLCPALWFLLSKLSDRVERQYLEAAEVPMVDAAQTLAAVFEDQVASGEFNPTTLAAAVGELNTRPLDAQIYNLRKTSVDMGFYITDVEGVVLYDSRQGRDVGKSYLAERDVSLTLQGSYGARSSRDLVDDEHSSIMFVGAPLRDGQGEIIGCLSVFKPQAAMFTFMQESKQLIKLLGFTIAGLAALTAVALAFWISRPIEGLTTYARAIRAGKRPPAPYLGRSEVGTLGRAFEEMRDALEGRRYAENYVQSLTHEMKSPLSAIRGAAELMEESNMPTEQRAKFLSNILFESDRLQSIIDRLLALSALESRKQLDAPEKIDLPALLDEVVSDHSAPLETKGLTLVKDFQVNTPIRGEAFLLEMAIGNLLQNAIDFSPSGGKIRITLTEEEAGVRINIEDEGPGVPEFAIQRAFERFYSHRPETGKSSGLGLCFVKEAAELHGGTAQLENLPQGAGTRASLLLPR